MRAIPKIGLDGLYIEDTLADDSLTGVVPIYAQLDPDAETSGEVVGYLVGIPVTPGLYLPKFDLAAWQTYQDDRGEPPEYVPPSQPDNLWAEGLTPEQIEELIQPGELSEVEQLRNENTSLKLALTELAEVQEADKTEMQLALAEIASLIGGV